jgi:hypothetical protein
MRINSPQLQHEKITMVGKIVAESGSGMVAALEKGSVILNASVTRLLSPRSTIYHYDSSNSKKVSATRKLLSLSNVAP